MGWTGRVGYRGTCLIKLLYHHERFSVRVEVIQQCMSEHDVLVRCLPSQVIHAKHYLLRSTPISLNKRSAGWLGGVMELWMRA